MFKVGKHYEFHMLEGGDDVTFWGTIEAYEHPLIKLEDIGTSSLEIVAAEDPSDVISTLAMAGGPGKIINVTSPSFISALEQPEKA